MIKYRIYIWLFVLAYTAVSGIQISTTSFLKILASQVPSVYANDLISTHSSKLLVNCISMCILIEDDSCSVIQFFDSSANINCFLYSINITSNFTTDASSNSQVLIRERLESKNLD